MKMPFYFPSWVYLVNGVPISGFAPGDDAVMIERSEDSFSNEVGVNGDMSVALTANKTGTVTLKLLANASSNTYLGTLIDLEEGGPQTFVPVHFEAKDNSLQDAVATTAGYILRPASIQRGGKATDHEWKMVFERIDFKYGGALDAPLP